MPQYQGVWNLAQQAQAQVNQQWVTDPLFDYTTLLLQADNVANGAQNNTFLDSSTANGGLGFPITRNGNTTQGSFSPFAQPTGYWGNYFDGSSLLTVPANNAFVFGTGDFTIEFWIYQTAAWNINNLINNVSSGNTSWAVEVSSGNISFTGWNTLFLGGGTQPSINAWHHVAVCRSGTTLSMFVDGVRTGTTTNSTNFSANNTLSIGGLSGFYYANGYLSNVRLVKGTAVYNPSLSTCVVPTSPLTAVSGTSVLTCQNNRFIDNSSNAFVVSVGGGTPSVQPFSPFAPQLQYTAAGATAWSASFGTSNYLDSTFNQAFTGTTNFCFETWMYPSATPTQDQFWFASTQSGIFCDSWVNTSLNIAVRIGASTGTTLTSTSTVTVNAWNHVAVTFDGTTLRIFINGVASGSTSFTMFTGTTTRYVVAYNDYAPDPRYFTGYLSNWRVSVGTPRYTTAFTPPRSPLSTDAFTIILLLQSSTFVDTSGNNRTVVSYGTPTTQSFSPFNQVATGGSGYFDGTGDYLVTPSNANLAPGTGNLSLECWAYFTGASGTFRRMVSPSVDRWNLSLSTTNEVTTFDGTNNYSFGTITPNQWYHFAFTVVSGRVRCFTNGVLISTSTTAYAGSTAAQTVSIGGTSAGANPWLGYIANVRYVVGGIPSVYSTTSTTLNAQIFTPQSTPFIGSEPLTAGSVRLLLNFTNAGIVDGTMKNNLETVGNAQISTSIVKYGSGSIYLDGTGDYLITPTNAQNFNIGSGDFTAECWFYLAGATGTDQQLLAIAAATVSTGSDWGWGLTYFGSTLSGKLRGFLYSSTTSYDVDSLAAYPIGTWAHVALCRANGVLRLFLNGVLQSSVAANVTVNFNTGWTAKIGYGHSGATRNVNGYIDDFRITKFARYINNFTPPQVALPRQ